jgi:hypothetical protein
MRHERMCIGCIPDLIERRKKHKRTKQNSDNPINDVILFHIAIFFGRVLKRKSKNFFVTGICSLFIIVAPAGRQVTHLYGNNSIQLWSCSQTSCRYTLYKTGLIGSFEILLSDGSIFGPIIPAAPSAFLLNPKTLATHSDCHHS